MPFQTDSVGRVTLLDLIVTPQPTPNPLSARFAINKPLLPKGTSRDFRTADSAVGSPLAERLFANPTVSGVFIGSDFITLTVTPQSGENPEGLIDFVTDVLRAHFAAHEPAVSEATPCGDVAVSGVAAQIVELLDAMVRPAVAHDGGDVDFVGYEPDTGIVKLRLRGACSGCPSSMFTLKLGIQNLLVEKFPGAVKGVEAVT